jgi:hypothetical protein
VTACCSVFVSMADIACSPLALSYVRATSVPECIGTAVAPK